MSNTLQETQDISEIVNRGLKKRYRSEFMFRFYGVVSILFAVVFLLVFFSSIISKGYSAFTQGELNMKIYLNEEVIDPDQLRDEEEIRYANFDKLVLDSLKTYFPEVSSRKERKELKSLVSSGTSLRLQSMVLNDYSLIGQEIDIWVRLDSDIDMYLKGNIDVSLDESQRRISDNQVRWVQELQEQNLISQNFNSTLFTAGDSREPELAGVLGALVGSFFMLFITFIVAFPLGVAAAIYLEEFAPKNKLTELIEVNISNLAAVPSIVFGLLGLGVLLNVFGFPRSTPLVGGTVLALMTLPTIIIACRASLKAVPPSIKEGALAIGATKSQAVFHHVVPLALPGTLTGTIIGLAQALGETAPLIMIGMVAFIPNIPTGITEPSASLPVQIFLWVESAERGFQEKSAAAIMIILLFLFMMNALAVYLRNRFEKKW